MRVERLRTVRYYRVTLNDDEVAELFRWYKAHSSQILMPSLIVELLKEFYEGKEDRIGE